MKTQIYETRKLRGWTSARLNHELREAGKRLGLTVSTPASLRVQISGWENGHHHPDAIHQLLLQEAFGLPAEALGFQTTDETTEPDFRGLVPGGRCGIDISDALLAYFADQFTSHARADNRLGPAFVLTTADLQLRQLERLAAQGPGEITLLTARYAEFIGWLLQDCGDDAAALRHTDRAVELAEANNAPILTAYSLMRKSGILTSLREYQRARFIAQKALRLAERDAPSLLPVCLRQYALTHSYLRDEYAAKTALQRALELTEPVIGTGNDLSPYCTTSYVQMEAALCLLTLGNPSAAAAACETAIEHWPTSAHLVRDQSLCFARLAVARSQLRQVDAACEAATQAAHLASTARSSRTIHMLRLTARKLEPFTRSPAVRDLRQVLAEVA